MAKTRLLWLLSCLLTGCLWSHEAVKPPLTNIRRERQVTPRPTPFVSVTVTRTPGAVRLHVMTAQRCRIDVMKAVDTGYADGRVERGKLELESSLEDVCYGSQLAHAEDVDVGLQVGARLRVLGSTSGTGDLEVPLSTFDSLFQEGTVQPSQLAQVLVQGVKAADLPIGEIVNRHAQIDAILMKCEQSLARLDAERGVLAQRLAELLDLQLQGAVDPRIAQTAQRLYARIALLQAKQEVEPQPAAAEPERSNWRDVPARWFERAKALVTQLSTRGEQTSVPEHVQLDLDDKPSVQPSTLDWAMGSLPTVCKITVTGGAAVAATLVATGPAGVALDVVMGVLGDDLSRWLTNRCCMLASNSDTDVPPMCETDSHDL